VQHEHKKTICDYFTGPKKRKIGTALSWRKTQSSFIKILHSGEFWEYLLGCLKEISCDMLSYFILIIIAGSFLYWSLPIGTDCMVTYRYFFCLPLMNHIYTCCQLLWLNELWVFLQESAVPIFLFLGPVK
jgi:hypothetical protein